MDSHDIDKVLDSRVVFRYHGNSVFEQLSRTANLTLQSALHLGDSDAEFSFFVPEQVAGIREISILLAQSKAKKHGDLFFLSYNMDNPALTDAMESIIRDSKTGVVDNLSLEDGNFYLSMRFNRSELANFSKSILNYTAQFENLGITYLGPNPGIDNILMEIMKSTRLTRIIWRYDMPRTSIDSTPLKALGEEWVSEMRYMTKNDVVPQIFKTKEKVENPENYGFTVVSEKDNLYELTFSNRGATIKEYHARSYERRIVRFLRHLHYIDEKIYVETVIPAVQTRDLIQAMSYTAEKNPEFNIEIEQVEDVAF